jgi:LPS export ABC transporter protein LptC
LRPLVPEIQRRLNVIKNHIVLLFFTGLIFHACTNDLKDVMALPKNKLSPSQVGDSVTMLYTDSAQLKIMLKANRMLLFNQNVSEPFTVLPKGVFVTFFDQDENVSATLKANYGVRYDLTRRMEAKYAVEVINKDGVKLETEKLIWDENTRKIYTDEFVKITTDKEIIMGTGMVSNQDFTKYELKKVTGTIQLKNDEL